VYTFYGRAHVSFDPEINDRVWQHTPEREQAQDPERNGIALIVELVRVVAQGRAPENNFVMGALGDLAARSRDARWRAIRRSAESLQRIIPRRPTVGTADRPSHELGRPHLRRQLGHQLVVRALTGEHR